MDNDVIVVLLPLATWTPNSWPSSAIKQETLFNGMFHYKLVTKPKSARAKLNCLCPNSFSNPAHNKFPLNSHGITINIIPQITHAIYY